MKNLLIDSVNNLKMYGRFCLGLKGFLKEKITLEQAKQSIKERILHREENFLKIIKKGIFENKGSPYLPLFKLSKCEYEDVERLIRVNGIEETLRILKADGVYFKIEEFKGRKPVARKGKEFLVREKDFDNPYVACSFETRSGGTRSAGTRIMADFDFISEEAINRRLIIEMHNLLKAPVIILRPAFPYGVGMKEMLVISKFGIYPKEWISLFNPKGINISLKSKLGVFYIIFMGRIFGAKFPKPRFLQFKNISNIAEIISDFIKDYKECCILTNISSAVRICLSAKEKGIDLTGAKFQGCGEPLTTRKNNEITSAGAKQLLFYAFTEIGVIGTQCLNPAKIDDVHVFKNKVALISHERKMRDLTVNAFLFTTLLPSAPKIFLNVESGDYGVIETKRCACPYDDFGFYDHVYDIRSFEKLTGEGMTFYGTDLMRIVEDILPSKFGGSSLDYQLVEKEGPNGITQNIIYVDPKVGTIDEGELIKTILCEVRKGSDSKNVMAQIWLQAGTIQVRRQPPVITKAGKFYPLHISKEATE